MAGWNGLARNLSQAVARSNAPTRDNTDSGGPNGPAGYVEWRMRKDLSLAALTGALGRIGYRLRILPSPGLKPAG